MKPQGGAHSPCPALHCGRGRAADRDSAHTCTRGSGPSTPGICSQESRRALQLLEYRRGPERAQSCLFAQQGSGMVWPAPRSWSPWQGSSCTLTSLLRLSRLEGLPSWVQPPGWTPVVREKGGELPPLSILSPLVASAAGHSLTGCHGCHLPWQQAKAVTRVPLPWKP